MHVSVQKDLSIYAGRLKSLLFEEASTVVEPPAVALPCPAADDAAETLYRQVMERRTEYAEFAATWSALSEVIAEPATRLRTALAVLAPRNIGLDQLQRALLVHCSDLEGERLRRRDEFKREAASSVDTPRAQMAELARDITVRREQIAQCQEEIAKLQQQQSEIGQLATKAETELQNRAAAFEQSAQQVAERLEQARRLLTQGVTS